MGNQIIPLLKEFDLFSRVYLCSESLICLNRVRKVSNEVLLVISNMIDLLAPEFLKSDGKVGKLGINAFNIRAKDFNSRFQKKLRKFGFKMFIWDLHTEDLIKKYLKFSPDAFYSDFPDVAVNIRDQYS